MNSYRVVWPEQGIAEVEDFQPRPCGDNELLVQTRVSLISPGTERAIFLGLPNAAADYPYYPGYCSVGEVIEGNSNHLQPGKRAVYQLPHASHALLRYDEGIPLPDEVLDEDATFLPLIAIALQGVRKCRLEVGECAIVIGAGIIGLLAMQLAKLSGALPVAMVDKDELRLEHARQMGADAAFMADEQLPTKLREYSGTDGAPVVIEASGHPCAIKQAFSLAANGGRVILLGSTRGVTDNVDFYNDVHRKGITIVGAHNSARPRSDSAAGRWTLTDDQNIAVKLLASGRLDVKPLLTHRFKAFQASNAYNLLAKSHGNVQGILLDWE